MLRLLHPRHCASAFVHHDAKDLEILIWSPSCLASKRELDFSIHATLFGVVFSTVQKPVPSMEKKS